MVTAGWKGSHSCPCWWVVVVVVVLLLSSFSRQFIDSMQSVVTFNVVLRRKNVHVDDAIGLSTMLSAYPPTLGLLLFHVFADLAAPLIRQQK